MHRLLSVFPWTTSELGNPSQSGLIPLEGAPAPAKALLACLPLRRAAGSFLLANFCFGQRRAPRGWRRDLSRLCRDGGMPNTLAFCLSVFLCLKPAEVAELLLTVVRVLGIFSIPAQRRHSRQAKAFPFHKGALRFGTCRAYLKGPQMYGWMELASCSFPKTCYLTTWLITMLWDFNLLRSSP